MRSAARSRYNRRPRLIRQPKRYKFLRLVDDKIRSNLGSAVWEIGEWKSVEGDLELCKMGFNCSLKPFDAFCDCQGEIVAEVEVRGDHISDSMKECWREMRVVDAYIWKTSDSVLFARFAADCLLEHYQDDPFPELEWEIAGIQPEDAAEWVVGCTIWLREEALKTVTDKFNDWMGKHINQLTPLTGCF
jgi:hypothetical protein